ncbi:MAG: DNA methyltransferase, partial [Bacteroidota bacterium]
DAEAVAGFLSRCLFAMFAEDAGLIPAGTFTRLLDAYAGDLDHLPHALADFFSKMDAGGYVGEVRERVRQFNGSLFKDTRAPRLDAEQRQALLDAARSDWADVEPSIFGTLLERALDPAERHKLGAHFTPRAYVERLVGPTILEPLRAEWDGARAAATRLIEQAEAATNAGTRTKRRNEARAVLAGFLSRLATVRVLDPACGSGNFLYVTFAGLKALEDEARRAAEQLVGEAAGEGFGVTPRQMRGLEVNARAAAIADLVLWIGYLQWHRARYGASQPLPEPVLEGYGQVEHRDAVLTEGGTPAPWPDADFIVGNPPFLGASRMREALGDAYTERLRAAYPAVPDSADFVMFWWHRAAEAVRRGEAQRFGLVTTNSLPQTFNRRVVERHLAGAAVGANPGADGLFDGAGEAPALALAFAVPDHPWVDSADAADVRVAMTTGARADAFDAEAGRLAVVTDERDEDGDGIADVDATEYVGAVNADLTVGADVAQTEPLDANADLANRGVQLFGSGFIVNGEEAEQLGYGTVPGIHTVIRPYRNGRDLTKTPRGVLVIDLFGLTVDEAREQFPAAYEHVLREVKPARDKNRRKSRRENWWLFGETNPKLRRQLDGLTRYIVTPETSKHRVFQFLDIAILPDNKLVNIALDDAYFLGVLSSAVHLEWTARAGGLLEDRPVYVKTKCFEPFPFPTATDEQASAIRHLGEAIDAHRKRQQETHPDLGLTDLYNAVEALRAGRNLTPKEQTAADHGLAHTLLDLHRQLDRAVLAAYGWSDLAGGQGAEAPSFRAAVLDRLVALNAARRAEEAAGTVRYLRPAFQAPDAAQTGLALETPPAPAEDAAPAVRPWPDALAAQMVAVRQAVAAGASTPAAVAARFASLTPRPAAEVLDALAELGLVQHADGAYAV